ncbi:MAG: four helix bundle protein [Deltaproteobacteria bacterium]|nr:four helix bundle protein [Deltaproteobacteria bacterium]
MATIKRFEDLECWQEARELVKIVYSLTKKNEFKKDYELVRQVRKSAVSSMGNIAEGFHRNSAKDFMRFLDYSRSSVAETLSHLYVALDQNYINESEMDKAKKYADIVWKKVNNFVTYLNKTIKQRK